MSKKKFNREVILASEQFACYQQDFLAALLTDPEYTISDARRIAEEFFNGKKEE